MSDLGNVILCDHHVMAEEAPSNVINLNARSYGIDGSTEASASGIVFFLALALNDANYDLSELGLCGAIGDKQEKNGFHGLNKEMLDIALEKKHASIDEECIFAGKEEIMDALEKSLEPYFVNFHGGGAIRFLQQIGLEPLKKLEEMDEKERKKFFSAVTVQLLEQGVENPVVKRSMVYGTTYGNLNDMVSKLNACARKNEFSHGIALCFNNEKAKDMARTLQETYRDEIRQELKILEKEGGMEMSSFRYFHTTKPSLTGTLAGLALSFLPNFPSDKPVIGLAVTNNKAEISGRGTKQLVKNGLNLADALGMASQHSGGRGGGHPIAAGASIPAEKEKNFLEELDKCLKTE
jgi:RecJ-like exonuclease